MFLKTKLYLYLYLVSVFGLSEFTELLKPPPLFHGHVSAVGVNVSAGGASVEGTGGCPVSNTVTSSQLCNGPTAGHS